MMLHWESTCIDVDNEMLTDTQLVAISTYLTTKMNATAPCHAMQCFRPPVYNNISYHI